MGLTPVFVGQRILIEMEFRLRGVPTDPTVATCTSRSPVTGTTVTVVYPTDDFTRRSEGLYEVSTLVDEAGTWVFRGEAAGIVDAVNEYVVDVARSGISG